jgi:signal transduction histidine kinase/CheY-like chemotaxis protein
LGIQINIFSVFLFIAALATGILATVLFRRTVVAGRIFGWLMVVLSIWAFTYGIELTSTSLKAMLFWVKLEYIGVGLIPGLWILFCLAYTGNDRHLTNRNIVIIFVIPVLTILLVWTNSWHYLHYASVGIDYSGQFPVLDFDRGVWYWVHTIYFYALFLYGVFLLLVNYFNAPLLFKKQTLIVLFGAISPWIANVIYQLGFAPFDLIDPTPFIFTLTGLIIGIGLLEFKLFDVLPFARDRVVENLDDGVLVLDGRDRIVYLNGMMKTILRPFSSDAIGKSLIHLLQDHPLLISMVIKRVMAHISLDLMDEDDVKNLQVSSTPLYAKDSSYNGMLLVFKDITEHKRVEVELLNARLRAEESDRLKTAFLANMSHEIRNPMNGIIGFAGLLREEDLTEEDRNRYIEIIEKNATQLLYIINDIIDVSKIESGQERIKKDEVSVEYLLNDLESLFKPDAKRRNLDLQFASSLSKKDDTIITDPVKLRQILVNVIGNALKFTVEGSVKVRVKKVDEMLEFQIKDTGVGINQKDMSIIFDRFRQSEIPAPRLSTGTGLGLSITRGYLTLMDGSISVDSEPGVGSTFYVRIPHISTVEKSEKKSRKKMLPSKIETPDWSKFVILLAEDEPVNVMYIKIALKKTNATILVAENGEEAINIFKENSNIDIVLMDIKMPVMDGFVAASDIRKLNATIPIIALSGHAMVEKERLSGAGFVELISKPVRKDDLITGVDRWLKSLN